MKKIFYLASSLLMAIPSAEAQTWSIQNSGSTSAFQDVDFTSATQGWVVGSDNTIRTTGNGGSTWSAQTSPANSGAYLKSVRFVNASDGMAFDYDGKILRTSNGGVTWTATADQFYTLTGLHRTSASNAVIVGYNGILKRTVDGGTTWTNCSAPATYDLYDVTFVGTSQGWASGSRTDYGDPGDPFASHTQYRAILHTSDGGLTWTEQLGGAGDGIYGIHFSSLTHGCAVGRWGVIWTTANGGTTWTPRNSGISDDLWRVHFASPTQGWAAGSGGTILATTDGGAHWAAQASGTTHTLHGLKMVTPGLGYAVGDNGTILRYTAPYITVDPVSASPVAAGAAISVSFSSTGTYSGANVFTAQLSDANGNFDNAVSIGSLTSTAFSGAISATVPGNTPDGSNYRIRIVSTSPVTVAGSTTAPLEVGQPLPLRLVRFGGEARDNENVLVWTTASERGVSHFAVERSEDAMVFSAVGEVKAGNESGGTYSFTDLQPSAVAYYRLTVVDADGSNAYSNIVKLSALSKEIAVFTVHPNPAADRVHVAYGKGNATISLSDVSGRILRSTAAEGGAAEFDLVGIPAGVYLLHCKGVGENQVTRIVKQ